MSERTVTFGVEYGGVKIGEITLPMSHAAAVRDWKRIPDAWIWAMMRRV